MTGLSDVAPELAGKRLELLRELVPNLAGRSSLESVRTRLARPNAGARAAAPGVGV